MEIDINKIGVCVGSEVHGKIPHDGESITYWGVFSAVDPSLIPLADLRAFLTKAYSIDSEQPKHSIRVFSLTI
jgi:hypothetical protein